MTRIKLNFAAIVMTAGVAIALTQSAFTPAHPAKKHTTGTEYQFNGTMASQEKSAADYSVVSGSGPSCSGSALVCTINVSGDLQTWLNQHTTAQILAAADQTRN